MRSHGNPPSPRDESAFTRVGISAPLPLPAALAAATVDLLGLVDAAGAVVRLSGTPFCLGRTPPLAMANGALDLLLARAGSDVLALDNLGLRYPELAACISEGSGALLLPLTPDTDDAIRNCPGAGTVVPCRV